MQQPSPLFVFLRHRSVSTAFVHVATAFVAAAAPRQSKVLLLSSHSTLHQRFSAHRRIFTFLSSLLILRHRSISTPPAHSSFIVAAVASRQSKVPYLISLGRCDWRFGSLKRYGLVVLVPKIIRFSYGVLKSQGKLGLKPPPSSFPFPSRSQLPPPNPLFSFPIPNLVKLRGKGPRFKTDPTTSTAADVAAPIPPGLSEAEWEVVRMMRARRDEQPREDFIGETEELGSEEAESSEPEEVEVQPPTPIEPIPIPRRARHAPIRPLADYDVAEHHGKIFDHFVRAAPPKFSGSTDPVEARDWLMAIEKALDTMGVPPDRRVPLASYQLKGGAGYWWLGIKRKYGDRLKDMTWATFLTEF
ncbi:hypothetical protein Droror1_Dr00027389 [Drosera rotundifolia]